MYYCFVGTVTKSVEFVFALPRSLRYVQIIAILRDGGRTQTRARGYARTHVFRGAPIIANTNARVTRHRTPRSTSEKDTFSSGERAPPRSTRVRRRSVLTADTGNFFLAARQSRISLPRRTEHGRAIFLNIVHRQKP
jgi:hypothetical protein